MLATFKNLMYGNTLSHRVLKVTVSWQSLLGNHARMSIFAAEEVTSIRTFNLKHH
jgi:hypothetical protein